jgi:hypothetical protein
VETRDHEVRVRVRVSVGEEGAALVEMESSNALDENIRRMPQDEIKFSRKEG